MLSFSRRATALRSAPTRSGTGTHRSAPGAVLPAGGHYGAGLIRGASAITVGEAHGHGFWIDSTFLDQMGTALEALDQGAKVRFKHPGLSSDGLGNLLGRATDPRLSDDGRQVLVDLHLLPSAHDTPEGNLADYVLRLASESPDLFGTSIVFSMDHDATDAFTAAHTLQQGSERVFLSPDPDNHKHLPHARLAELRAVDVVDSPAANPGGMFSALGEEGEMVDTFAKHLSYALGITRDLPPTSDLIPIHPDRLRRFTTDYLEAHHLTISQTNPPSSMFTKDKSLQDRLEALEAENNDLRGQLQAAGDQLAAREAAITDLTQELSAERESHSGTSAERDTIDEELSSLRADLDSVRQSLQSAEEKLSSFDAEVRQTAEVVVAEELAKMGHPAPLPETLSSDLPGNGDEAPDKAFAKAAPGEAFAIAKERREALKATIPFRHRAAQ